MHHLENFIIPFYLSYLVNFGFHFQSIFFKLLFILIIEIVLYFIFQVIEFPLLRL